MHFIDVGQGDCQLIVAGDTRVLIDSGEAIYADRVINYISQMGFRRLDYVIATHQHDDHIGGMSKILDQFTVGKIYMPQVPDELLPMSTEFESMLDVIEKRGITAEYSSITTSSTPAFIEAVSPQYSVISVGKGNSYGHPKTEILDRLSKRNCEIYTTMHSGTIVFVSDGENFTIYTDSGSGNFEEEEAA